jgi:hypothetical protein
MESEKKLLGAFENARGTCCQAWIHPDRCVVRTYMENPDYPEVLAVALIPEPEERKRRERLLARLLLLTLPFKKVWRQRRTFFVPVYDRLHSVAVLLAIPFLIDFD